MNPVQRSSTKCSSLGIKRSMRGKRISPAPIMVVDKSRWTREGNGAGGGAKGEAGRG